MLDHWFSAIASFMIEDKEQNLHSTLSKEVRYHTDEGFPNLQKTRIAIIGSGNEVDLFRSYLYQFAGLESNLEIADLGNFKKKESIYTSIMKCQIL